MGLTVRQARFVEEYAARGNGAAAAVAAGYAAGPSARVTASRLLTKANVKKALEAHTRGISRRLGITRDRVLAELQNAIETARTQGEPMTEIAGWREIAKLLGYYREIAVRKLTVSAEGQRFKAELETMSDEDLLAVIEGGGAIAPVRSGDG